MPTKRKWLPFFEQAKFQDDLTTELLQWPLLKNPVLKSNFETRKSQLKTQILSFFVQTTNPDEESLKNLLFESIREFMQHIFNPNTYEEAAEQLLSVHRDYLLDMENGNSAPVDRFELFFANWSLIENMSDKFAVLRTSLLMGDLFYFFARNFDKEIGEDDVAILLATKIKSHYDEDVEVSSCKMISERLFNLHKDYSIRNSL